MLRAIGMLFVFLSVITLNEQIGKQYKIGEFLYKQNKYLNVRLKSIERTMNPGGLYFKNMKRIQYV